MATESAIKKGDDHSAKRQEPNALTELLRQRDGRVEQLHPLPERCARRDAQGGHALAERSAGDDVRGASSPCFIFGFFFWVVDSIFSRAFRLYCTSWAHNNERSRESRQRWQKNWNNPPSSQQPERNERFKWYILHAYSGFERKVRESIESRVQAFGLKDKVGRVMIPTEPVTEIVNGKKRTVERVFLPGYVLVEMDLDNNLWHVLKDTPKVTGFLGTGDKPVALSEEEVSSILFRSETAKEKPRLKIKFEKNEPVRITDGPFANFNGIVDEINEDRETMKVMVTIFGRSTPVELEFSKVEKIE